MKDKNLKKKSMLLVKLLRIYNGNEPTWDRSWRFMQYDRVMKTINTLGL